LSHEVISSIERILNVQGAPGDVTALDTLSSSFSPVGTLNELFPNEASLNQLETIQLRLAQDAEALQTEIDALRKELQRDQDPQKMQLIQEMISDLMGQMSRIREQATESEAVVRDITKDIQLLDLAKKNLTSSMTSLKRFQMLANALSQLDELIKDQKYAETSQTLAAVKELSAPFKSYLSVPQVALIWARIQTLQGELRTKLDHEFDAFFLSDPANPIKPSLMTNACLVVDVIGDDFRSHLIERYCAIELKEYRRIFRTSDEAGQLDNLARRFAFFRRMLQTHDNERARVFPPEWKVGQHMSAKFTKFTREDLSKLLEKAGSSLTVATLLQSLQQALDFEAFISKKYSIPLSGLLELTSSNSRPVKSLASAFEPHMGIFIDAQNKVLSDMLAPYRGRKTRTSLDAVPSSSSEASTTPSIVLPSSTELFYFYGQILEQCSKLFAGKPLLDLANLQKKWLKIYSEEVLFPSLKRPATQSRRSSSDTRYDIHELKNACLLVNTAEYCQVTASELEERITDKIANEFKDEVSFQAERDLFISVVSSAILVQLRELETAIGPSLDMMSKTSWASIDNVSGPSQYVADLTKAIGQVVDTINPLVEQKKYLRNFYDKAAALVLARFTNALVRNRPLREIGAEQLLLDLQEIRTCLLKLPGESPTTTAFNRSVTKSTTRLETLLKVIIPPADPPESFILNYTLLVGDSSFSNFQKVLDLKGTPRAEQNDLLDSFVTITSTKPELEGASFLSTLDMDPQSSQQIVNLTSPAGSRVHLPSLLAGANSGSSTSEGILSALASPPLSGPSTGSDTSSRAGELNQKREVFSDLRRFVSFGLRRDTAPP
ncbi:Vps53-like protein, partial [Phellopilus nigrolimitatus]